jgi:diguanylate cyclase (GGDEF)-like protein
MADIDHFKSINDFFGHLAGDHALKCVSAQLKQMVRDSDQIARYGGEEFAIILPMTDPVDAMKAAERLRKGIESLKLRYNDKPIALTMSFGAAAMENESEVDVEGLIKKADEALYEAKNTGRNRCCLYRKQDSQRLKPSSPTVMVVDDEEVVLVTVTKMLERLGYAVIAARSGKSAVDSFQKRTHNIDVVIMDMVMPDIGADHLLEIIRQCQPGIKVVLSSGYSPAHVQGGDLLRNTDGFLQKPYQLAELSKIVRAAIDNEPSRV